MFMLFMAWSIYGRSGHSAAICPTTKSQLFDARAVTGFIENVSIFGKPDRQTAQEFARDEPGGSTAAKIEKRYAASGDLSCGDDDFGQAQVVLKNDIIVSAGHVMNPKTTCPLPPGPPLTDCKFSTTLNNKTTTYEIERVVKTGFVCKPGAKQPENGDDWVILKLKKPVGPEIKPYRLANDPEDLVDQSDLVQVGKSPDFNPTHVKTMYKAARHYGRCSKQYDELHSTTFETDCDASHGSSGSGLFLPGPTPVLLGITTGISKAPCTDGNGTNGVGEYRHGCWVSLATRVTGDFFNALKAAGNSNDSSRP